MLNTIKHLYFPMSLLVACLVWLVPTPSVGQTLEKVSIQLHGLDQFQAAGYYIAKEKSFYENAGLDVTILPFVTGDTTPTDSVVSGAAQYGIGRSSLLIDYHKGAPIVALSAIFQAQSLDDGKIDSHFYDGILFTSQHELNIHPNRAETFANISLEGWAYALEHIEETAQLIKAKYNIQNKTLDELILDGTVLKKLAYIDNSPLGEVSLLKLKKMEETLQLMNVELSGLPLDNFMWNQVNGGRNGVVHFTANEKKFINDTIVRTATTTNWPPFAFVNSDTDQPTGVSYDYWQEIRKIAGLRSQITTFENFSKQLQSLKEKQQDLIYSTGITEERKTYAKFTEPYAKFPISIATSKEENFIQDASFLKSHKVAVGKDFTAHKMMLAAFPKISYIPVKNAQEGLQMVSKGDAYAYVDIMPTLAYAINEFGFTNLKISGNTGLMFELRLMIRNDYPELVSIANKVITNFDANKKREIENRWFNVQYQQQFDYNKYLPHALVLFAIFSTILFTLHRSKLTAQRTSAENKASERRYRRLLELTSDEYFIYSHDTNGVFQYLSPSIKSVLGYDQKEFSNHYTSYLTDSPINQEGKRISALSIKGEKHPSYEEEIRDKNGLIRTLEISKSPVFDEANNVIAVEGIARDITKRKQAEVQLIEAKELAEMTNNAKTHFLAAASHDLRQPLQAANLFLHALKMTPSPSDRTELMERLEQSLRSFGGLLDALLDISKLEAGDISPFIEPVHLSHALGQLVPEFSNLAAEKGLEFRYVGCSLGIATDINLFNTVIRNLLANAIRYTEHGKTLLGCRRHGDFVSIEIWDTGIGIAEDHVEKVFDEFYQVGNKARDHKFGLGLGLSIVKRLSQLLGYTFSVKSELGKGTRFTLKFPIIPVAPTAEKPKANQGIVRFDGKSVIIVEDNDSVREGLKVALNSLGFNTLALTCGNCKTCLTKMETFTSAPNLIIADYRLTGKLDGIEVITNMRQRYGDDLPAILLTGDLAPSVGKIGAGLPPLVLNKPVSIADLSDLMRSIL